ncbi:hypothetical protein [Stratiformator vulcanicus]|uniref:Uncharacterized protein n=1 Tax=Stratiformator vulcanicus TaxID=2527980 RepID=A0A517QXU9_9PLAN|nr:hypothetical protein [Stratiformator vulcanicus]QDT36461.1 hypothetical protein Pan189_08180 [Stratiformator vulcanicus]
MDTPAPHQATDADAISLLITPDGEIYGEDSSANQEIVRRIQACVNACDGITTEELENGIVADMRSVIGQVAPLLEQATANGKKSA